MYFALLDVYEPDFNSASRSPGSEVAQEVAQKETSNNQPQKRPEKKGSKADQYIKMKKARKEEARKAEVRGINPQSYDLLRYFIVLTPDEAQYGCYKTINYRGQQVSVEFVPNSKAETVQVSFKGEVIYIESAVMKVGYYPN